MTSRPARPVSGGRRGERGGHEDGEQKGEGGSHGAGVDLETGAGINERRRAPR